MNDLELYCGIKSNSYNEKVCVYCNKKYKHYVGTINYTLNKLDFCSYNCRSRYKKLMKEKFKEEQEHIINKKKEQEKKLIEKQRQREREKYEKYKEERELYKSVKDINEYDLTEEEKILFYGLKYFKSQKKISEEMNITPSEVKSMKVRLIHKLKEKNNDRQ